MVKSTQPSRRVVSSCSFGVKNIKQLAANLEIKDMDMNDDVWQTPEEKISSAEDYLTFFYKLNYNPHFKAVDFHDEAAEML